MTKPHPVLDTLSEAERTELARLVDSNDAALIYETSGSGMQSRRGLIAKGLLDGRRGKILTPLGLLVAAGL